MWHFSCRWYGPPVVDLNGYPRISNPYCHDIQIRRCEWTLGKKMTQSKSQIKNSKLFYMYAALLLQVVWTPQKLIWIDTQGSLTHIATIFKFGDVSGPRAKKWPKVNCRLKEVNEVLVATHHTFTTTYFDNMWDNMWVQFFLGKKLKNIFDITQKYS